MNLAELCLLVPLLQCVWQTATTKKIVEKQEDTPCLYADLFAYSLPQSPKCRTSFMQNKKHW